MIGDFSTLEEHIERNHNGSRLENAVVDDGEVWQVGAAERDLVPRTDTQTDQAVCDLIGGRVDSGVRKPDVIEDDRRMGRGFARGFIQ